MSSLTWPDHLLSLDEWDALPEDDARRFELVEGMLQMSPRPTVDHQFIVTSLAGALNGQLRARELCAVVEVDVVLAAGFPPTLRAPDLVVLSLADARRSLRRCSADQVQLAVEIVSPGSGRTDRVAKLADYADAGIANYWILTSERPIMLDAFALDEGSYGAVHTAATGTVALERPVPMTIDLATLLP